MASAIRSAVKDPRAVFGLLQQGAVMTRNHRSSELQGNSLRPPRGYHHRVTFVFQNKKITGLCIGPDGITHIATAASSEYLLESQLVSKSSKSAARHVALLLAERMKNAGIVRAFFDDRQLIFHGRMRAFREGLLDGGVRLRELYNLAAKKDPAGEVAEIVEKERAADERRAEAFRESVRSLGMPDISDDDLATPLDFSVVKRWPSTVAPEMLVRPETKAPNGAL